MNVDDIEKFTERMTESLTGAAREIHKVSGAPNVIVIACSMDEEEPLAIGMRVGEPKDIVVILERALAAARAAIPGRARQTEPS